ncbi:hypothetical protein [Erythrobacter sp. HKB08]|uniref:hypothetical protein n=1 Tax=Erythrobacter sp. HKB08 TaxID=2502843 RepID=UPI001008D4E5|nr:hypothetical protein [Erythrobacter sp. HKB08]
MATTRKTTTKAKTTRKKAATSTPAKKRKTATRKKAAPKKEEPAETPYGVLVGWATDDLGSRLRLRMQSTRSTPKSPDDIEEYHYYLDKDQAVLLANFLFRVSGHTAPKPAKPEWLRKLLGER